MIRHRRSRRMATNVLQPMATNAAVDSPAMLASGSMMKNGLESSVGQTHVLDFKLIPWSLVI